MSLNFSIKAITDCQTTDVVPIRYMEKKRAWQIWSKMSWRNFLKTLTALEIDRITNTNFKHLLLLIWKQIEMRPIT